MQQTNPVPTDFTFVYEPTQPPQLSALSTTAQPSQPPSPTITFNDLFKNLQQSNPSDFKSNLNAFIKQLIDIKSQDHVARFDFFVQNNILKYLLETLRQKSYDLEYFEAIFHNIQVLIQNISLPNEKLYLVSYLHKQGYFEQKYPFVTEQQVSYYILILRSLVRKMLLEQKDFINIFVNSKQPHFPIVYSLMRFYNHPQSHVVTASRYILLELAAANFPYLKQTYFINFPFVTYYAQLACQLKTYAVKSIKEDDYEKFLLAIMFFEEFVGNNDWESINMYANAFFAITVRALMKMILKQDKVKVFRFFEVIAGKIKIEKVLYGLRKLFFSQIQLNFLKYLESPEPTIFSYSETFKPHAYLDSYTSYIKQHCSSLHSANHKKKSHSIISSMWQSSASYIVYNEKGLEAELDKISSIIGVNIQLNTPIDHYKPLKYSYVGIFQEQQIMTNNPYFKSIIIQCSKNQHCYFYFLKVLAETNILYQHLLANPSWHLSLLSHCQSLSSIKLLYKYLVPLSKSLPEPDPKHQILFSQYQSLSLQKIISYLLEQGWKQFQIHGLYLSQPSSSTYETSIFRDISCDILFLMTLNLLLKNQPIINTKGEIYKEQRGKKTKIIEKIVSSFDSQMLKKVFLRFNCQYLEVLNEVDEVIETIKIAEYKIYQDPSCVRIIEFVEQRGRQVEGKRRNNNFTLYFSNDGVANYMHKTLSEIRSKVREFEHQLENIYFNVL